MRKRAPFKPFIYQYKIPAVIIFLIMTGSFQSVWAQSFSRIKIIKKEIHSPGDIVPINDSLVIPYVYTNKISLNHLPVPEKKQKFFDMLLPSVLIAKTHLDMMREHVEILARKKVLTRTDSAFLRPLMKEYHTDNMQTLIHRLQTFPVSIVLAQAAIESGWGSSRFFLQGNNIFGMWSFNPDQNRMAASSHRNGTKIYLQKFNNLEQAIRAYYTMLDTRRVFAAFRKARTETDNPLILIDSLKKYSERGEAYVDDLARLIRVNHLQKYDSCKIAPAYLKN